MHWDMEGVSGIFTREHVWYWEEGVREHIAAEGRQLLIADINSAAAAALEAGVDELIVCDTHHGGENIILDQMLSDPAITYYNRSVGYQDGERRWMRGLDDTVDGLMLMGHHAKAGTEGAFLPLCLRSKPVLIPGRWNGLISRLTDRVWARWGLRLAMFASLSGYFVNRPVTGTFRQS